MSHIPVILAVTIPTLALGAFIATVLILKRRSKTHDAFQVAKSPVNLNVDVSVDVYTVMSQDQVVEVPYSPTKEPHCITALPQNEETRVQLPGITPASQSQRTLSKNPGRDLGLSLPEVSPCSPFMLLGSLYEDSTRRSSSFAEVLNVLSAVDHADAPITDMPTTLAVVGPSKSKARSPSVLYSTADRRESLQSSRSRENSSLTPEYIGSEDLIPSPSKAEDIYGDDILHVFVSMDVDALISDYQSTPASPLEPQPQATPPTACHESVVPIQRLSTLHRSDDTLSPSAKTPSTDLIDTALSPKCRPVSVTKENDTNGFDELVQRPAFPSSDDSGYVDTTDVLPLNTKGPSIDAGTLPSDHVQLSNGDFSFTDIKASLVLPTYMKDDLNENPSDNVPRTPARPLSCSAPPPVVQTMVTQESPQYILASIGFHPSIALFAKVLAAMHQDPLHAIPDIHVSLGSHPDTNLTIPYLEACKK
ncbi:hypothetical protein EIP86_004933 [Pleurotus ostreatoroseus]|nr:hypothetical protein EIP86_004933 [Pleurotus ostreatoroseus]